MKVRRAKGAPPPERPLTKSERARKRHESMGQRTMPPKLAKSEATRLTDGEAIKQAAQMRIRGASYEAIAEALDCTRDAAIAYVRKALEYQSGEITELASDYIRDGLARYDRFMAAWYLKAFGGIEVDAETGKRTRIEPTEEAARIFLRAQRDLLMMLIRARPAKLEISASAAPANANVDSAEMARIMRQHFGNTSAWTGGDDGSPVH